MCIVFFWKNPCKGLKRIILFNRDESINRKAVPLDIQAALHPSQIMCGMDLEANGTWMGINVENGNYGFLTNYENKPF